MTKDLKAGQRVKKWFNSDHFQEGLCTSGNKFAKILWDDGVVDDELAQDLEPI